MTPRRAGRPPAGTPAETPGATPDPATAQAAPALLFESVNFAVRELSAEEVPGLQVLFEANPEYFIVVGGQPPRPDEALQEFHERVPEHLSFGTRWFAGAFDRSAALRGLVILVSDLSAQGSGTPPSFFSTARSAAPARRWNCTMRSRPSRGAPARAGFALR